MQFHNLKDFTRGYIIGNFVPSLFHTPMFEVAIVRHKAGEFWPRHRHAYMTEYNVLLRGRMKINHAEIGPDSVFVILPNEITKCEFLEDCELVVIKSPSIPNDKEIIDEYI